MYYYTISIIVFLLISAYIAYLIGRFSYLSKMDNMLKDIDELKKSNQEKVLNFKELEEQIYHQSSVLKDMQENEQQLHERIQIFENEKKQITAEGNLLSKRIDTIIANETSKESLYSEIEVLDGEALRWKNEYTVIHNELSTQLTALIKQRESDRKYIEDILSQKYELIRKIETNFLDYKSSLENLRNTKTEDSLDKQNIAELELKNKRKENIIKALRFQLQNLNLQKINDKKDNNQLSGTIKVNEDEEMVFDNEIDRHDEMVEENDYHEIIDEANQDIFELFDKLKEFKEEKVRKTGEEQLNYSEISRRIDKTIESRQKSISSETVDSSYQESDTELNSEVTQQEHSEDRKDLFDTIGLKKLKDARLTMIFNINRDIQNKLYSFGINSFEQIALLTDDQFPMIEQYLGINKHSIKEEKWIEQAQMLTNKSNIRSIYIHSSAAVTSDQEDIESNKLDLIIIKGIGKTYRERLQNVGIEDLQDLANWKEDDIDRLAQLLSIKSSLIIKQQWLKQARNKLAKTL